MAVLVVLVPEMPCKLASLYATTVIHTQQLCYVLGAVLFDLGGFDVL